MISLNTTVRHSKVVSDTRAMLTAEQQLSPSSRSSPSSPDEISPDRPPSHDGSLLTVYRPSSPTTPSLDGETLRSRSGSFTSSAPTVVRSRAGSNANSEAFQAAYDDVPLSQALKPDPRYEQDFHVEDNRFAFSPGQLNKMLNPKSLAAYRALGGLDGLAYGLRTHLTAGLSIDEGRLEGYVTFEDATQPWNPKQHNKNVSMEGAADPSSELPVRENQFADRLRVFGRNKLPDRKPTGFLKLLWNAYNDKIIVLLTIAAVISLSLGLYGPYSTHGRIMSSLQTESEPTPLQVKLGKLADWIGWLGTRYVALTQAHIHLC